MKNLFLLLLIVSSISLSALAQSETPQTNCGIYLKRDVADPTKVLLILKPDSIFSPNGSASTIKKIETYAGWTEGSFILLIPDDDVTAEMTFLLNDAIPANGGGYMVEQKEPAYYTDAIDGKRYRVLAFSFLSTYAGMLENKDNAYANITYMAGQEYPIASFTFTNLDQTTTPIRLLDITYQDAALDVLGLGSFMYGEAGKVVATKEDDSEIETRFIGYSIPLNMLTTAGGSVGNDCAKRGAEYPNNADFPNFTAYQELPPYNPLPVSFGPVTATIANSQLLVHWSTLTETNNDHFIIEASKDGKAFTKLSEVKSQAVNGNSNAELTYNYATPLGAATSVLGALAFLGIGLAGFSTKKKLLLAATTVAVIAFTYSCSKKDMPAADAQQKIWVRIAQVDKDGTTKYSKAVEAVRE